jgi:hypothetical protein
MAIDSSKKELGGFSQAQLQRRIFDEKGTGHNHSSACPWHPTYCRADGIGSRIA